ncbi:hypothetical protein LZ32DRAFT_643731 [Colletotrichum eremochloae]|nr:hypothetical protein LZ32DRAFT_643731 [Colletotrichum eremochloae]
MHPQNLKQAHRHGDGPVEPSPDRQALHRGRWYCMIPTGAQGDQKGVATRGPTNAVLRLRKVQEARVAVRGPALALVASNQRGPKKELDATLDTYTRTQRESCLGAKICGLGRQPPDQVSGPAPQPPPLAAVVPHRPRLLGLFLSDFVVQDNKTGPGERSTRSRPLPRSSNRVEADPIRSWPAPGRKTAAAPSNPEQERDRERYDDGIWRAYRAPPRSFSFMQWTLHTVESSPKAERVASNLPDLRAIRSRVACLH